MVWTLIQEGGRFGTLLIADGRPTMWLQSGRGGPCVYEGSDVGYGGLGVLRLSRAISGIAGVLAVMDSGTSERRVLATYAHWRASGSVMVEGTGKA